jgi:hypothetical protein
LFPLFSLDKPTIDTALSTNYVNSWNGNAVTFKCIANGLPLPIITWYKPGNQQIINGLTVITNGSKVSILTTENSADYGLYRCQATNVAGDDEHHINVTQLCKLKFYFQSNINSVAFKVHFNIEYS